MFDTGKYRNSRETTHHPHNLTYIFWQASSATERIETEGSRPGRKERAIS
jgi:hypothetical protein